MVEPCSSIYLHIQLTYFCLSTSFLLISFQLQTVLLFLNLHTKSGIHAAGENSITPVSLDTMTHLKKGCSVDVRIFFAERCEKSGSKFRVITDMEPIRPNEGGAFRCLGNGSIGGDSGILIQGNGTDDASIERRNAERLLQIGIILGKFV